MVFEVELWKGNSNPGTFGNKWKIYDDISVFHIEQKMELEYCFSVNFVRYTEYTLDITRRSVLILAKHVHGSYCIVTSFIPDRPFVHIGTIYVWLLYRTGVRMLSMVTRNNKIIYYYTRVNISSSWKSWRKVILLRLNLK